jgi:cell division protein FtsB
MAYGTDTRHFHLAEVWRMTWLEIVGVLALIQYGVLAVLAAWWLIKGEEDYYP